MIPPSIKDILVFGYLGTGYYLYLKYIDHVFHKVPNPLMRCSLIGGQGFITLVFIPVFILRPYLKRISDKSLSAENNNSQDYYDKNAEYIQKLASNINNYH